ncbi:hypothetical protein LO772_18780 [Yinghuangia sp. ASG 101]|uniref:DUF6668 family protein n=1 Tax=Yinghuangia sp. ASG 101 TaxID=2896848 RepID=UPI001E2C3A8F|nr:DUF6668 family protein [Yinghuangia sp. ASG 101]UGQ09016.1 hypothetical protein LO772_18780 [Yinghuangia sp. ASG 101]
MNRQQEPLERNPWVPEPAAPRPVAYADRPPSYVRLGPTAPHRGLDPPSRGGLPLWTPNELPAAPWWWVGCHGGAGTTTLSQAVGIGADSGIRAWPVRPDSRTTHVVIVARTHARGLIAAQTVARQWAAGHATGVVLLGLVAVADAPGRLPKDLRDSLRFVAGGVPRLWRIPWVEGWRSAAPGNGVPGGRETVRLAADLSGLVSARQETP